MTARNEAWRYVGLFGAIFAGSMFADYIATPNIKGADQIRQSAALIQNYTGSNPEEPLNQTLDTLNTIEAENTTYVSELNGLEFTVEAVKEKLATEDNAETRKAAMDELGNLLKTYAHDHYKDPAYLVAAGVGLAISVAGSVGESVSDSKRRDEIQKYIANSKMDAKDNDIWRNHDTR